MLVRFKSVRFSGGAPAMVHHVYGLAYDDYVGEEEYKNFDQSSVRDHELQLPLWGVFVSGRRLFESFGVFGWLNLIFVPIPIVAVLYATGVLRSDSAAPFWLGLAGGAVWLIFNFAFYLSRTRKEIRKLLEQKAYADRRDECETGPIMCVREAQWESFRNRRRNWWRDP
jgi:hypothetical protein